MQPSDLCHQISVHHNNENFPIPEWAALMIWLGYWSRLNQQAGKRLIVFTVMPTRDLAAAFAGIGSLIAGAIEFEDRLSWFTFKSLPTGKNVFWIDRNTDSKYTGEILGFKEYDGTEFIVLKVTHARRKAEVGYIREISRTRFDEYRFTEEKPLSIPKSLSFDSALQLINYFVENPNPKWIWTDGSEALIISALTRFEMSIDAISFSVYQNAPVSFMDLLCIGRNKDQSHAKLRIEHPRGAINGYFPLAILDGRSAFEKREHLSDIPNLLVLLDRGEYRHDIEDAVLSLRSISSSDTTSLKLNMPNKIALGFEIAAYLIDA